MDKWIKNEAATDLRIALRRCLLNVERVNQLGNVLSKGNRTTKGDNT